MKILRNKLHALGYSMHYTFGISKTAEISPWRNVDNPQKFSVDMSDTVIGTREVEGILRLLQSQ